MSNPTDSDHVTLFRGAADNTYFELYFNSLPSPGAENVQLETHEVDLKPDREVILHVEIFNPTDKVPLIVTPGGMGECDGFRGFARNVAAASSELKVIIWDRRNMGRSEVSFGTEPLAIEEAEDLHVLIQRLGVGPATLYGMWTYPEKVEGLLTAGNLACLIRRSIIRRSRSISSSSVRRTR